MVDKMLMLHCFQGGTVVKDLESKDKFEAIRELLKKAPCTSTNKNLLKIEHAVIEREKIYTTGLGRGVAIAHGKTSFIDELVILLGISRTGIDFNALDGQPVHLLFLIANPPEKTDDYLLALSTIARIMRDTDLAETLENEKNPRKVEKLIAVRFRTYIERHCN